MTYLLRRVAFSLLTVFVVVTINFAIFRAIPGDAASALSRCKNCTPEYEQYLRTELGLDRSKFEQYLIYLRGLAHGDLGRSFVSNEPVGSTLWSATLHSLPLVLLGNLVGLTLGLGIGLLATWRRGTAVDSGLLGVSLVFSSMPSQWLALMIVLVLGGVLPPSGIADPYLPFLGASGFEIFVDRVEHLVLPALTIAIISAGSYALLVRSALLETLGEDYILTARAMGKRPWQIIRTHALRNALLPLLTIGALTIGYLVAGAILVESVFSYPGIGYLTYQSIGTRDFPLLQGAFLVLTISVVSLNLVADLVYPLLDPRVRA